MPIYKDYQNQEGYLGEAELVRFVSKGLPFMLHDYTHAPVFNTEKWQVKWIKKSDDTFPYESQFYNIRYTEGEFIKEMWEENEPLPQESVIFDSFLEIDGEQIY